MKKTYILLIFSFLIFIVINNSNVNAEEISGNDTVYNAYHVPYFPYLSSVKFDSDDEERWFKIELKESGGIKLQADKSYKGLKYYLYSEESLQKNKPIYSNTSIYNDNHTWKVEEGIYYILLTCSSYSLQEWKGESINYTFDFIENDQYENNDTWDKASKIELNNKFTTNLNGYNDKDWFKIWC